MDDGGRGRSRADIGNDIRAWCKDNNISNRALAAELGNIANQTLNKILDGENDLTSTQIAVLMELMGDKSYDFFIPTLPSPSAGSLRERLQKKVNTNKRFEQERRLKHSVNKILSIPDSDQRENLVNLVEAGAKTVEWNNGRID